MKTNIWNSKRFLSLFLALVMVIGMLPMNVLTASAAEAVTYIDRYWDESTQTVISQQKTVSNYTVLTSSSGTLESGWYVLNSNITTTNVVEISGEVHIILMDGCTWTPSRSIIVNNPNKLYIYGQANDTGKIKSNGDSKNTSHAAIGSPLNTALGTITINGGTIDVNQPGHGAAIGCGDAGNTSGDGIIINGGVITAVASQTGAAIGGTNKTTNGAKVTINGGTVTATYNSSSSYNGGTAIGAGSGGSATVTIRGGYITATNNASGRWAAPAIGAGSQSATVTITGGTIIANSVASYTDASIGGSSASVTIDGGNIQTNDGVTAPKNSAGTALALVTLTLNSVADGTVVTNIDGIEYGKRDVKTIGNKLYLYLPENAEYPSSITAGGKTYYRSGDTATYTDHIHSFTYQKVEGENKINAICGAAGCTLTNGYGGSVTVTVPTDAQIHTGKALTPAVVTYSLDWQPTDKPEIVYTDNDKLGTATGTLQLGDAKIEISFDIVAEIKLNANGGNGTFDPLYTDIYGNLQGTLPADVEHNSLFFTGWADAASGGNTVTDATIFNGSTTIYAQFVDHQHNWTYTKDGDNKIIATCSNEDTHCPNTDGGYITVAQPSDLTYTGSAIEAVVDNKITTSADVSTKYEALEGDLTEDKPVNVGKYKATLSIGGKDISVEYSIKARTITENDISVSDAVYTGSALTPTVTVTVNGKTLTKDTDYKVEYSDNTAVGSATVTVTGDGNYTGTVSKGFNIGYLTSAPDATITGETGSDGWYTGEVILIAPENYTISKTVEGAYSASVSCEAEQNETVTYYLKNANGEIAQKTVEIKIDLNAPTATYNVKGNGWREFVNFITFGIFCKDDADLEIKATDTMDSSVTVEYYISSTEISDASTINGWNTYTDKVPLNPKAKNYIYIRVTDDAGHSVVYESGVVVFTDSKAETETITFTKTSEDDVTATVVLNNNTVKTIYNGTTELTKDTHYSVENGTITFKAGYLDTLAAGDYTLTVHYNPLGESYVEATGNEAPATTTIALKVVKAEGSVSDIQIQQDKVYDGSVIDEPSYTASSTGTVTIEYKKQDEADAAYTTTAPTGAGKYTVRVTVAADENYKTASNTADFEIKAVDITAVSVEQDGDLTYNKSAQTAKVTTNATAIGNNKVTFTYSDEKDGEYKATVPAFTDAGTHTVYFKANADNHNEAIGSFTVTIDKATVTEPTISSKPYTGETLKADVAENALYTVAENKGGVKKGEYNVVLKLNDSKNYKWSTDTTGEAEIVTLKFVITGAANSWDNKPDIKGWTYGDVANEPTYKAKFGTVNVAYTGTANDGTTWNNTDAPTKAGSYTATFTVDATADYGSLKETVDFTIAKKAATVTANNAGKTYGDSDPALSYTNTELVGTDELDITVTRASGENAKTYTITASQADGANPNYNITFETGTFTINKADLTVTVDNATATYGDAVPNYTVKYEGFVNGDDRDDLGGTLVFDCDYAQFDDKGEYTIKANGYTSGNYNISYVDGKLTVSPKKINVAIDSKTSVYGDPIVELTANDFGGIVNGDTNVYELTTEATSTSGAGDYEIKGEALDDNYQITFMTESVSYTITKREVTITVDAKNVVVNTALPTYTYTVDNLFGEDKLTTEPTLTSDADITVIGEYDITASGADAGSNYTIKYVPAKLSVLTDNAVDAAKGYEEEIKDLDPDTVTSEDKAELTEILDEINTILDDDAITDNGKKALEETKEKVEELIKAITDAEAATDTENSEKVKDVTAENVTPEDKTDLEKAKEDFEKALEEHGSNMTDDEKKAVEDEIKRIDDALEVIGNVENVEELIDKLPDTIKKDDAEAIKAADDAYNALSDYEKTLVDADAKKALDDAKAALAELNKPADSTSPNTGDNSNMFLWIALLFISGGAVITVTVVERKKRIARK